MGSARQKRNGIATEHLVMAKRVTNLAELREALHYARLNAFDLDADAEETTIAMHGTLVLRRNGGCMSLEFVQGA